MNKNRLVVIDGDKMTISKKCSVTGRAYRVQCSAKAWDQWKAGACIQDAFPDLNAEQREFIMIGTTPAEWNKLFPSEEET